MVTVWQILGNLGLLGGGLLFAMLCVGMSQLKRTRHGRAEAAAWTLLYGLLPFTAVVWIGLLMAVGLGGFDWIIPSRSMQVLWVSSAFLAWMLIGFFSGLGIVEEVGQLPWVARPLAGWGMFLILPVCLAIGFLGVNRPVAVWPPIGPGKLLLLGWDLLGLGLGVGVIGEWSIRRSQREAARLQANAERQEQRHVRVLEEVQRLDPEIDFLALLGFCNRFEDRAIRELAEAKVRAHSKFLTALQQALTKGGVEAALIFMDGVSLTAGEQEKLRPLLPEAVQNLAAIIARLISSPEYLYPEIFDFKLRVLLGALEKCGPVELRTREAVRELRSVLEQGRALETPLNGRRILDQWLQASRY